MVTVNIVVEGKTDEFVARRLLEHVGLGVGTVYGLNGKADILMRLSGYNQAARFAPWFVLVDLDNNQPCTGQAVRLWLPNQQAGMRLRVAVQAVESWILADAESLAAFLAIPSSKVSPNPDLDPQPKRTLINLARMSRRKAIREDMVPRQGSSLTAGPHYADRLIEFIKNYWQPDEALKRSESLQRCVYALSSLTSWDLLKE